MTDDRAGIAVRRAWAGLLDLVYPPHCIACGRLGAWLCAQCLAAYPAFRPPWCARCGLPLAHAGLCRTCRRSASPLQGVRSVGPHVAPLREAVHALKYEGMRVLTEPLAELMAATWSLGPLPATAMVPVPLHPQRVRRRGYDQAALLGRALAPRLDLPLHEEWLRRERNTPSQVGLTRPERWVNVRGAFHCPDPSAVVGQQVLLIDDVSTSGATLRAAAEALRAAGAAQVWALTLTRAQPGADALPGHAGSHDDPPRATRHQQTKEDT